MSIPLDYLLKITKYTFSDICASPMNVIESPMKDSFIFRYDPMKIPLLSPISSHINVPHLYLIFLMNTPLEFLMNIPYQYPIFRMNILTIPKGNIPLGYHIHIP